MIYVALAILSSTAILIIFRALNHTKADTRHTITINYLFAAGTCMILFGLSPDVVREPWLLPAVIEGGLFYIVFRAIGHTAQISGVATAGIATKMSVVIPISVGIFLLNESWSILKLLGICAGFIAVFLAAGKGVHFDKLKWPLISFFGIGIIDTSLKLFQVWSVSEAEFPAFISIVFGAAFLTALGHHLTYKNWRMNHASILCGAILGIVNFATLYFMLKALGLPGWESSVIFPIINFGVVLLSTISALVIFRENLSNRVWTGLGFASISIWLLFLSGQVQVDIFRLIHGFSEMITCLMLS